MSNSNKSLNDLFRAASSEVSSDAEGGVLSQSEVEQLLRNSNVHSVPVTIGERLYSSLFSTPFKIGMTAMTFATGIALGIIALPLMQKPVRVNHIISPSPDSKLNSISEASSNNSQPLSQAALYRMKERMTFRPLPPETNNSAVTISIGETASFIKLTPLPLPHDSVSVTPTLHIWKFPWFLSDTAAKGMSASFRPSWYAGFLMGGVNRITNSSFTALLPALTIINGVRIGEDEVLGLRIGFEFINPVIIAKYVHMTVGIDSHTFFGNSTLRPFIWAQASLQSAPFAGGGLGLGALGLNIGAGTGVQFRMCQRHSLMLDAGYQTITGSNGVYTVDFGIGF